MVNAKSAKDVRWRRRHCFVTSFPLTLFLKKWAIPGLFFFIFVFSMFILKFRNWLDSNSRPLVLEATLPTEHKPYLIKCFFSHWWEWNECLLIPINKIICRIVSTDWKGFFNSQSVAINVYWKLRLVAGWDWLSS